MKKKNEIESKVELIKIIEHAGSFAENKDIARNLREKYVFPLLKKGKIIHFDYSGVNNTTQSFTHALISEAIRTIGVKVLDKIFFKNCNNEVQRIIKIVVEYMQGNMDKPIS